MRVALEVSNLVKSFNGFRAVDEVSFKLNHGEVIAILGPNGSGKTTSLRCIAGLLNPDSGSISVSGFNLKKDERKAKREFAYLPQYAEFPSSVTVFETVSFHAKLRGVTMQDALRSLGESGFSETDHDKFAGNLSGGMKHRLALAVAGLSKPSLVLLDEPTANLDPAAAIKFRSIVKSWREAGRSVLMATHVLADVIETADRVLVLVGGKCVADESVSDLRIRLNKYARLRVDVGEVTERHRDAALAGGALDVRLNGKSIIISAPEEKRLAILQTLDRVGIVRHFETERPSLDDLYLEYIERAK